MTRSRLSAVVGACALIATAAAAAADNFPDVIELPTGWRPEGIEAGPQHTLYVGSIPAGAVRQIDARTGANFTLVQPTPGRSATGLEYDRKGERLFVSGGGTGAAYVYDARTGAPIADYLLTPAAPRFINDNVLTKDAVYFTDSQRPWLYRLPLGADGALPAASAVQTIPLSGDYVHTAGVNNLNGIVATPNGKTLIAVQSNTASLLKIDPGTGVADRIELTGGDATNGDGLLLEGNDTLYVVQNRLNRVAIVQLADDLGSGTVVGFLTSPSFRRADHDRQAERALLPAERALRRPDAGRAALPGGRVGLDLLVQADQVPVGRAQHREPAAGDVDDARLGVAVRDLGLADGRERAVGDLAERRRSAGDERAVRLLDVVDAPEHEGVVDPRQRREAEPDVVAAERREVVAGEQRAVAEQLGPRGDGRLEITCGEDDVREAVEHCSHSSRRF